MLSYQIACMPTELLHNEKELLELIANSDELAFARLLTYHKDRIFSIAFKLTKSTVIAEEIVHDVFLKIWINRADLYEIQNFSAYLFIVTRNDVYKVLKRIAKNYKVVLLPEEVQIASNFDSSDHLMDREYKFLLQSAVDSLPSQQKLVYGLVREQGLKRDEVAIQLNIQPDTVKYHLSQAIKNIRDFCLLRLGTFIGFLTLFIGCW